jgi:methylmalonyl-CoA mutase
MPEHTLLDQLLKSFPKTHKEDWLRVAAQENQGKNPLENLTWKINDEIIFTPYSDQRDVASLDYLRHFEFSAAIGSYNGPRSWACVPRISISENENVNAIALNHLANGADGILFDLGDSNSADPNLLLSEIDWPSCSVSFLVTATAKIIRPLSEYVRKKKFEPRFLTGTIFCNSAPADVLHNLTSLDEFERYSFLGIYVPPSSPVKEIVHALLQATSIMDAFTDAGYKKELIWRNINISFASGTNFFLDIAKQRALRLLLYQVGQAYQVRDYTAPKVNMRVGPWTNEKFQPHANLVSSPIAALAAITGGCDSLTIVAEDESNVTMRRIARNVSNILREEVHLNKVADPLAGAYSINNIVDALAQEAWKDFQQNVSST